MDLQQNLQTIRSRISQACARTGRDPSSITLVAVTKAVSDRTVQQLIELGVGTFGENRAIPGQRRSGLFPQVKWHLIGPLQSNKVKYCRDFDLIHSLERLKIATLLNQKAAEWDKQINVLIQVNISGEDAKHGLGIGDVLDFARILIRECPNLNLRGLMGMAPYVEPEKTRSCFQALARLHEQLRARVKSDADVLSMGMSNDFEVAVEEGATMVRIGSALFMEEE
ncbi:MAG: YggS family pyridoxal phosphate-dependent enzyme [Firmicutes bacterium]|jgi:pyridoxal phosphate enzyme (YggS family)|nr:YggS family pyridoxal phosphate-dependent enzyme [Bacillota bacterium]NLL88842.1 YggS family pyridoxal phosphate-dependent enzyme [Bacillota bacterium]HKM17088.1 YggS family pyridoxal phosphate-dependent enzyme [Limnochordia bacterium]